MADTKLLETLDENQEVTTSIILDTLMYTDNLEGYNGSTVGEIIEDMRNGNLPVGADAQSALANLEAYKKANPKADVWNYRLYSSSDQYGDKYKGARGATFFKGDETDLTKVTNPSDVYVAFRGTGEGRWYDNGEGLASEISPCQQAASDYFDSVMEDMQVTSASNVLSTGHSKGGNHSLITALNSKHGDLIDKVISVDGQGVSPEAEEYFKELLGEDVYEERLQKMYSICGDNDYVNVLGKKIVPDDHTVYIKTANDGFSNAHALYSKEKDGSTSGNLFNYEKGEFFETTDQQKEIALFAAALSSSIMDRSRPERAAICHTVMSIMEVVLRPDKGVKEYFTGMINHETFKLSEIKGFIEALPSIWEDSKAEGIALAKSAIGNLFEKFKASTPGQFLGQITASVIQAAKEKAIPGAMAVLDGVSDWISDKYKQGKEAVKNFGSNLLEAGKNFCNDVKNTFNKARDFITGNRGGTSSSGGHISDKGSGSSGFFGKQNSADIIIDEGALSKAISDFSDLSKQLQELRKDIEQMLTTLKAGFDTPAGRKFIKSCENNLITPLEQQRLVIEHISENLQSAQTCYSSVFSEYNDLVNKIKSYQS